MTITGPHVKAARELLGWTRGDLAIETTLSVATIGIFEDDKAPRSVETIHTIRLALQDSGVEIVAGERV